MGFFEVRSIWNYERLAKPNVRLPGAIVVLPLPVQQAGFQGNYSCIFFYPANMET
jgi:hypothetical protein